MDAQQKTNKVCSTQKQGLLDLKIMVVRDTKQSLLHLTIRATHGVPCTIKKQRASTIYIILGVLWECDLNLYEEPKNLWLSS